MKAHLVPLHPEAIRVGQPLPCSLMDAQGTLLAQKGFIFSSRTEIGILVRRCGALFIDPAGSQACRPIFMARVDELPAGPPPDWLDYQGQADRVLRDADSPRFLQRLVRLQEALRQQSLRDPDAALFALFHLSAGELRMYSATHALLVSVLCGLAARDVLAWPREQEQVLWLAALTMNIGMTDLQDRLAQQLAPPSPEDRQQIARHADRSADMLAQLGVSDPVWLDAVRLHHSVPAGPLAPRTPGQRMARLIQRADMFSARLAPRAYRVATSSAAAMQACYFDEHGQIDEAGAALIKAVGVYAPGCLVRLQSEEIAVVLRRGANTTTPKVALVANREGLPVAEPVIRDTGLRDYRVVAGVPYRAVRVQVHLPRMLAVIAATTSDRL